VSTFNKKNSNILSKKLEKLYFCQRLHIQMGFRTMIKTQMINSP